jgi:TolB-like protein/DNA-binding winged helix-turn-helix (wHTH) protein
MSTPANDPPSGYRFADLTLDIARRSVARHGEPIELKALDFDLLRFLVEQAPNIVNADALAEKVWGRHFVSPENVAQRVMLLRQSLSDDATHPRYVETVRNKGYRLIPVVESAAAGGTDARLRPRWLIPGVATLLLALGITVASGYWVAGTENSATAVAPARPGSVAVLPFDNQSPNDDDAMFVSAMQDEIVSQLTKIRGLEVFPVGEGGPTQRSPEEVALDLNVATTLGGSVYHSNGRVRVIPRLIDATTGAILWSEPYERELDDIFAIQSEIALEVANALRVELSALERERVERVPTTDAQAQDHYLMARARNWYSLPEIFLGIADLQQALQLDPEFKEAWLLYSQIRAAAQTWDLENSDEHRQVREEATRRALALDPEFGAAYAQLGVTLQNRADWIGAEEAYRRAADLNVPLADLGTYGVLHLLVGKVTPYAQNIFEAARAATPQNETFHRLLAFTYAARGEWAKANELYDFGIRRFAADGATVATFRNQKMHWLIGREELAAARAMAIDDPLNAAMLSSLDAPEQALTELRSAYAEAIQDDKNHPSYVSRRLRDIALWAGHFNDTALALNALRAAVDEWYPQITYAWLPQMAETRRLPEFKTHLRDIRMVDYWRQYGWGEFCSALGEHDFECH